tara:strand:+ start:332 stop:547 length:216 start_codon:yes stop_codon:yes gene_type:complete
MRGAIPLSFFTTIMLNSLSDLLESWCNSQQLEFLSADDLLHGYYQQLTIDQRDWLNNYIELWDQTQQFEVN